ncbi:hypothetical protein [Rubellicoccus peritrichatus]|uniref:Uncharacterized protein n=1 Tax=Rubellicoccus peritrichatus TaxID=3080537 RepID=A0AAQ3L9E6_9BACT|nr:hypothetical protein [Puniceicoccus sp. CR14]WOO41526.1 hypothetical protein RZN69_00395 [Puniceicoccus sp. CR14]
MLRTTPYDMAQIELALEQSQHQVSFRSLLFIFWGVIVAKCSLLQWAIYSYNLPIDGWVYVWAPSFIFGILCMVVYAKSSLGEKTKAPLTTRLMRGLWIACGAAFIIFIMESIVFGGFSPFLLPGIFAVLMGVGYFIQGVAESRKLYELLGIGWWLGACALLWLANVNTLAWLSAMLIALQAAPATVVYLQNKRNQKPLNQALEI